MKAALYILIGAVLASGVWYYFDLWNPQHSLKTTEQRLYREQVRQAEQQLNSGNRLQALDQYQKATTIHQETLSHIDNPNQPPPASANSQPVGQVISLEDFRVITREPVGGIYEFQLDSRVLKQDTEIQVSDNTQIEFWASGTLCANTNVRCVGPNGQDGRPVDVPSNLWEPQKVYEFPVRDAYFQSAVAYIGTNSIQIGEHRIWTVPSGTGLTKVLLGANVRAPEVGRATGGFRVRVKVN